MNSKHEITVKVDKKEWDEALTESFKKNVKDVKVDGFRKGNVPRDIFEKKFGKERLYPDAIDIILPKAYQKMIDDNKIIPVVQPAFDIKSISDDGVELLFTVITKPSLKIKKYKGLKVAEPTLEITDEEVEKEVANLRNQYAEIVLKDEPIENGDTAVIDFEGFKDGEPFEGGKGENYPLEIGSHTFIPGFEEQLIGLKKGDEKEVELTFPEDYPSEDLKGQKVSFKVKVNEVKTKIVPELNEEFFKDLDMEGITNKDELYKMVKEEITQEKERLNENKHIDDILETVAKEVEVDIPEEMITEEIHRMIHQFEERLKMQGIGLEQYYQITGTTHEKLHEQFYDEAKKVLTFRLMIEEIAELEAIEVTEKEAEEEMKKMASKYQMTEEDLLKALGGLEMVVYDTKMRRTLEFLRDNNKQ